MEEKPYVLLLSNTNTKPQSLIKLISKSTTIKEDPTGIIKCNWFIDSKYYTTEVTLVGIEHDFERSADFNNRVEAIIIHLDANKCSGLEDLDLWNKIDSDCDAEIKILVANYCNEGTSITKAKATEWSLERGYEFIEIYPTCTEKDTTFSDFDEKVGVDRIIEALHSHTWSNLTMKSPLKKQILSTDHSKNISGSNADEYIIDDVFDDFTEIFSQVHNMRDSLNSLPPTQKKQFAEQMVTAFWNAIGGNEEELADFD